MKELSPQEWLEEIDRALEFRQTYGRENLWARLEKLFYNRDESNAHAGPNLIVATGDAMLSSLTVPYPYVTVRARRMESSEGARMQETVDNILLDELQIRKEVEAAVVSAYLWGRGILKVGYDSEFGWDPQNDFGALYQTTLGSSVTQFDKRGTRIEYNTNVRPGMPWVKNVLPHDFVVPWGTSEIEDAYWCAHRVIRHIDDLKADIKYSTRGLKPTLSMADFVASYESSNRVREMGRTLVSVTPLGRAPAEFVELWEIHDKRTGKVLVVANGHESFLRNERCYLQLENRLPFASVSFVPRARNFWVTSDAAYLISSQLELSDIALQNQKHRRSRVLKFLIEEGMFSDDTNEESFLSADVGMVAKVRKSTDGQPIANRIVPFNPQADQGAMLETESVRRDARELVGLSSNQMGEFNQSSRRSATEASIVSQASNIRMDRRQAKIAYLYGDLFRIINPICWEFWTSPQPLAVLGQNGEQQWVTVTGQDIKGSYAYEVGFSMNQPLSLQQRKMNALQLYQLLRQDPMADPREAIQFLVGAFNDPEFSRIFQAALQTGQATAIPLGGGQGQGGGGFISPQQGMGGGGAGQVASAGQGGGGGGSIGF